MKSGVSGLGKLERTVVTGPPLMLICPTPQIGVSRGAPTGIFPAAPVQNLALKLALASAGQEQPPAALQTSPVHCMPFGTGW